MEHLEMVLKGVRLTLVVTVLAYALGVVGGVPLFAARMSRFAVVRATSRALIEILRGIPPIVWLFLIYFGFGNSLFSIGPTTAAVVGLGLITAAYLAEIYRGSYSAIPKGQVEAANALRFPRFNTWYDVLGPQLVRISIPAATTWGIGLLKDSSIASTIGVTEIIYYANNDAGQTKSPLLPFIWAGIIYIALTIPFAILSRAADRKLRRTGAQ